MLKSTLLMAAMITGAPIAGAATLKPAGAERFFVAPDEPAVLRWHVESGALDGPVEAIVRDYGETAVAAIPAELTPEGVLQLTVKLPAGFYEVEFPAAKQRFGVMSLAAYEGPADLFFSIDAAMSWLVRGDEVRESLIKVLKRTGLAMSRERLNWAQISPARGKWDWESPLHYDTIRRVYAHHGVAVLEMFHGTTRWAGNVVKYPADLVGTAKAWREIGRRWQPSWGAMEVWNEPDIFFGGNLPADQYVPLVKTIAYAFAQQQVDVPLVGGVFAHYLEPYLDNAAGNGLLDQVDVISFHTYGRAPGMEALITHYRRWLAAHGREAMPLWITECGRPWRRGPNRPPADQDAQSALDITMKAVESRACGIARYFAFVYPFYEERDHNFGMMGRQATPLRSMAAYARLVSLLAHKRYLGDLRCDEASVQRARLFGDDRETVAVLYTGSPNAKAKLKLGLPVLRLEGIDGRVLKAGEDGTVPVPDGLVYAWLDRRQLGDRLQADTPAKRLSSIGLREPAGRKTPSPIVLRYRFDPDLVEAKPQGYRLKAAAPDKVPLEVRVFNLSPEPHELKLDARPTHAGSQTAPRTIHPKTHSVHVPAEDSVDVAWQIDLSGGFDATHKVAATVTATGNTSEPLAILQVDFLRPEKQPEQ